MVSSCTTFHTHAHAHERCSDSNADAMRRLHWHVSTVCVVKQVSTRAMPNATLAGAAAALAATPGVGAADAPVSQRFKAQVRSC